MVKTLLGFSLALNFIALTTALVVVTVNTVASAQVISEIPPSQIPQIPRLPSEPLQLPTQDRPDQEIQVPNETLPPQEIPEGDRPLFISGFKFSGNTVLSNEQLNQLAQPYLNREITLTDLLQLRSKITAVYVKKGYTTSGAYIPVAENQYININDAVVTVQIIEGTVGKVKIAGDARLSRYVRERLDAAIAPVLNQTKLEEALRLLQVDPLVKSISVNLSTGAQVGTSDLSVDVSANPTFSASVGTDNRRVPSIGSIERVTQLSASNLLALGESFRASYSNTEGSNGFSAGVEVPVNANNGSVSFDYSRLNGRIIEKPLNNFDIRADSSVYALSFQQPLLRRASNNKIEEFSVGISASRLKSATTLSGFSFPISPGADDNGKTRITELSLLQEYTRQVSGSALRALSQFNFGINALSATIGPEPNGQYFAWRGQVAWLKQVFGNSQLSVSGDTQISGDQLVPLTQFSLGGPDSIRGYRQDALITDSGLIATAELAIPILEPGGNQQISVIPFAGAGIGWNNGAERALDKNFLAAVGLGLRYELGGFTTRLNYAVPFTEVGLPGNSLQENGFNFELGYRLRF